MDQLSLQPRGTVSRLCEPFLSISSPTPRPHQPSRSPHGGLAGGGCGCSHTGFRLAPQRGRSCRSTCPLVEERGSWLAGLCTTPSPSQTRSRPLARFTCPAGLSLPSPPSPPLPRGQLQAFLSTSLSSSLPQDPARRVLCSPPRPLVCGLLTRRQAPHALAAPLILLGSDPWPRCRLPAQSPRCEALALLYSPGGIPSAE